MWQDDGCPTTDDVQGAQGDVAEAVEGTLPGLLIQLLHQDFCLLVHHLQEVGQDGEVKGGRQHLPPATPLGTSAESVKSTGDGEGGAAGL